MNPIEAGAILKGRDGDDTLLFVGEIFSRICRRGSVGNGCTLSSITKVKNVFIFLNFVLILFRNILVFMPSSRKSEAATKVFDLLFFQQMFS